MWAIRLTRQAQKSLAALHPEMRSGVTKAINRLAADPFTASNVKALKGSDELRLRVGQYRIIYRLEDDELIVVVVDVGARGGIYD